MDDKQIQMSQEKKKALMNFISAITKGAVSPINVVERYFDRRDVRKIDHLIINVNLVDPSILGITNDKLNTLMRQYPDFRYIVFKKLSDKLNNDIDMYLKLILPEDNPTFFLNLKDINLKETNT